MLSLEEEKLLTKHMDFYRALETGKRQPTTEAQEHFVRVTRGLAVAETVDERAYAKHMQLRAAQRAAISGENPHDPADGPTPEWFPDEGWYKLRGRQHNDMRDARKYSAWSETAAKENLSVEGKQMLSLTNQHFTITFSKPKESSNAFMNLYVPDFLLPQSSLPPPPFSITLDKVGVDRLLSVITNLQSRREKFIAFRDEQDKIVRQRQDAEQNEKARADELLH
jgi:hypothetical protein